MEAVAIARAAIEHTSEIGTRRKPNRSVLGLWVAKRPPARPVQGTELSFKQLRSSYSDDGGLRAEGVTLCWRRPLLDWSPIRCIFIESVVNIRSAL